MFFLNFWGQFREIPANYDTFHIPRILSFREFWPEIQTIFSRILRYKPANYDHPRSQETTLAVSPRRKPLLAHFYLLGIYVPCDISVII